jgi:hypothetical protein
MHILERKVKVNENADQILLNPAESSTMPTNQKPSSATTTTPETSTASQDSKSNATVPARNQQPANVANQATSQNLIVRPSNFRYFMDDEMLHHLMYLNT